MQSRKLARAEPYELFFKNHKKFILGAFHVFLKILLELSNCFARSEQGISGANVLCFAVHFTFQSELAFSPLRCTTLVKPPIYNHSRSDADFSSSDINCQIRRCLCFWYWKAGQNFEPRQMDVGSIRAAANIDQQVKDNEIAIIIF